MKSAKTISISMPEMMLKYIEQRATLAAYGSVSEYIRDLVRLDYRRVVGEGESVSSTLGDKKPDLRYYRRPGR